jgi:hypothetical protein
MSDIRQTPRPEALFDFSAYPPDSVFHDRRSGRERRDDAARLPASAPAERRARPDRRRRIDPTTFEKQYTPDELEFMNAMQQFKVQSGKTFPSFGDVLRVAARLGYQQPSYGPDPTRE